MLNRYEHKERQDVSLFPCPLFSYIIPTRTVILLLFYHYVCLVNSYKEKETNSEKKKKTLR